jgi:hypothetical protein
MVMKKSKKDFKHLKTKSMDNISIKVHPPWYARGTPIVNPRDGPPMAKSDNSLIAIDRDPSARGKPGEDKGKDKDKGKGKGKGRGQGKEELEVGVQRKSPPGVGDRRRGETKGKIRLWLTLKSSFFNTKNSVYSHWYALLGRKTAVSVLMTLTGLWTLSGPGRRLLILTKTCQRGPR